MKIKDKIERLLKKSLHPDIVLNNLDPLDDEIDELDRNQEDQLLKINNKVDPKMIPSVPCPCSLCDNWIDKDVLYYIIGDTKLRIICLLCAEEIFKSEDSKDDEN